MEASNPRAVSEPSREAREIAEQIANGARLIPSMDLRALGQNWPKTCEGVQLMMAEALDAFSASRVREAVERCIKACHCLPEGLAMSVHQKDSAGIRARACNEAIGWCVDAIRTAFAAELEQHQAQEPSP